MGFFSWKCAKSGVSVASRYNSDVWDSECYVVTPNGIIYEEAYEGYGDFGGFDIFELLGEGDRIVGIEKYHDKNRRDELPFVPKIVIAAYYKGESYDELEESEMCPDQGYFFDEDHFLMLLSKDKMRRLYGQSMIPKEKKLVFYDDKDEPTTIKKEWEKAFNYKKAVEIVEERKDEEPHNMINQEHYRLAEISFDRRYELPNYVVGITLATEKGEGKIVVFDGVKEEARSMIDETNIEDVLYTPSNELYDYPVSKEGFDKALETYKKVLEVGMRNYHETYWLSEEDVSL